MKIVEADGEVFIKNENNAFIGGRYDSLETARYVLSNIPEEALDDLSLFAASMGERVISMDVVGIFAG
ncbi:TPA: hypothetical protein L7Z86_000765 [Klebsiella quasipneumoniae subsp. similipneumoniae]|nr:hypothetical protein [Klebsiella quasipneumoniae subsp. similipneumoniae]